jgi:uncharacterized protein with FMN-binding domain
MIRTGKMLLSGSLILVSGSYAWWNHQSQHPVTLAAAKEAAVNLAMAKPVVSPPVPPQPNPAPAAIDAPVATLTAPPAAAPKTDAAAKPETEARPKPKPAQVAVVAAPEPAAPPPPPTEPLNAVALAPQQPAVSTGRYADGEFIGNAADGQWGPVQVKVVIKNGDIADVICLEYPIHRQRSAEISEWALPQLHEEVIKAQSANIEWISQASFTSENYQQSLVSALARAKRQP